MIFCLKLSKNLIKNILLKKKYIKFKKMIFYKLIKLKLNKLINYYKAIKKYILLY